MKIDVRSLKYKGGVADFHGLKNEVQYSLANLLAEQREIH